jgi:hypothetical protein
MYYKPHPKQERTNGGVFRLLQQCKPGKKKKQESGQSEYVIEDEEYNKGLSKSLNKAY